MFVDRENLFSNAQALTVTAASTDLIDLGQERRLGVGEPMCVVIGCDVAMAGTTPTMIATLQSDDNAGFSSATSVVVSPTFSSFAAGAKYVLPIPPGVATERYIRVNYTMGGTTPTITVTTHLMPMSMVQNDYVYPDGFVVS
jgi:hypothetical protein